MTPNEFMEDYTKRIKRIDDELDRLGRLEGRRRASLNPLMNDRFKEGVLKFDRMLCEEKDRIRKVRVRVIYKFHAIRTTRPILCGDSIRLSTEEGGTYAIEETMSSEAFSLLECEMIPRHNGRCPTSVYVEYTPRMEANNE